MMMMIIIVIMIDRYDNNKIDDTAFIKLTSPSSKSCNMPLHCFFDLTISLDKFLSSSIFDFTTNLAVFFGFVLLTWEEACFLGADILYLQQPMKYAVTSVFISLSSRAISCE